MTKLSAAAEKPRRCDHESESASGSEPPRNHQGTRAGSRRIGFVAVATDEELGASFVDVLGTFQSATTARRTRLSVQSPASFGIPGEPGRRVTGTDIASTRTPIAAAIRP